MNEILTANSIAYTVENVETGINTISFRIVNPVPDDTEAAFKDVKSLTVGTAEEVYGEYTDVEYESLTIKATGEIIVAMHILSETEKQIRNLQATQAEHGEAIAEHDEAIAAMMFGGEANE